MITIKGLNINYLEYGNKKGKDLILLHGWGQNIEMMKPLGDNFLNYHIYILDLPGFGSSDKLNKAYEMTDYLETLEIFVKEMKIKNPTIIGHSFGGRLAIMYAATHKVEKLVLFGSPCVRVKHNSFKEKTLKLLKKLPGMNKLGEYMKKYIGSTDYRNAKKELRETLVNTVNLDLTEYAKKISCPTLLIWGTLDEAAPIKYARILETLLKDGALIELEGYTHYAYLEALPQVVNILNNFL